MLAHSNSVAKSLPEDGRTVPAAQGGLYRPQRKRRHPRIEIPLEGIVHKGHKSAPCRLRNISGGGALIEIDPNALIEIGSSLRVGQPMKVEIPEIGTFQAHPTRMYWKFAGMSFEEGTEKVSTFIAHWQEGQTAGAH